jgi:hypothetical protein
MEICYDEVLTLPQEPIDYDNSPTFSLEAILSPQLALQLQRARAVQQEAARATRDAANALKFKDCEAKLEDIMKSILHEAAAIKRRECKLQCFQSSIAGLERTCQKSRARIKQSENASE